MKDSYYFPHDYQPIEDPKMKAFVGEKGATGYGVYWCIVEMLHAESEHKLPFKEYIYIAIAKQMLLNSIQVHDIIEFMIKTCELFKSDDNYFWSERVLRNIAHKDRIRRARAAAGSVGGQANAKQKQAKRSKVKESKGKDIKERKEFTPPTVSEVAEYCKQRNNGIDAEKFIAYYDRTGWIYKGQKIVSWKACVTTWEKRDFKNDKIQTTESGEKIEWQP